jgi:TolB-like protein/Tfp pilus assembly protein PilF
MKTCPQCHREYSDETLNFCLEDGAVLESARTTDATAVLPTSKLPSEAPTRDISGAAAAVSDSPPRNDSLSAKRVALAEFDRRLLIALVVGAVLIAAGVLAYRRFAPEGRSKPIDSIAVLPFQDKTTDADTEYLSEGLAESLIYRLSQLPDLRVTPTSTVFRYQGAEIDPVKVGGELGVNAVLSGRIVHRGDSITISADLVDVRDQRVIWGEQYDRKMSQLLDTQREIANDIVEKLRLKVAPDEKGLAKHYTQNNEAYQAYLKGRYYWNKRTDESMHKSIDFYKQAIEIDPGFALAYSGLADTYNLISAPEAGGGDEAPGDMLPKAKAAALKALEIDDTLAEAHTSLAHPLYYYDRDWAGAERQYKRAIELNPRYSVAHHWYAVYLTVVGRHEEALVEIKKALELDPLSLSINVWLGWILAYNGRPDAAIDQLLKTRDMDPNFLLTHHRLALVYAEQKRFDEALAEANETARISKGRLGTFTLASVYASAGKRKEALEQLAILEHPEAQQRARSSASIAMVYATLGDKDAAFKWLEKANDERDLLAVRVKYDPRFANLRGDPRLDDLVRQIGLP